MKIEEKINILKSFADEIITENELKELFLEQEKNNKQIIAYDGFEPSGEIHIAQGLLKSIIVNKLTEMNIKFKFLIADWFAFLNHKLEGDIEKIRKTGEYFIEVWKSCGMDLDKVEFVWASDIIKDPKYWEIVLKLSPNITINRILRCGQIMGRNESTNNYCSQVIYPIMQAADMVYLNIDIAQLGMDQRKVNMLAREIFPKLNYKKPIALHHHMLLGLQYKEMEGMSEIDKKIAMKMSKSKPETAIFMNDSEKDVIRKFKKAYCPEGIIENNPVLEYAKYIVFERFEKILIERKEEFGGNLEINSYEELEKLFVEKKIHPIDLKLNIAKYINILLEPVRKHFEDNKKAKELYETVKSYKITR